MALHDLATLADALTFALLTAVSGAIAWGVIRVATRRYGLRRTTSTVSAGAVLTLALGTMAMWSAARGGTEANTGGAIPDGSAPETQRTTTPTMPALEPAAPPSTDERLVDANAAQVRDGSQDEVPNPDPTEDGPGGSGPGDPGTTPDPPPSQSPPPDPPPSQSPPPDPPPSQSPPPSPLPPPPSPSPSPDDDDDDDDDDDRRATS